MDETSTKRHCIGYLRVSKDEQAKNGLSLDAQRADIACEAERRGWTVEWFTDNGKSAKNLRRPGITAALSKLRGGEASVLVVKRLDRLSRSVIDFAGLLQRSQKEGWAIDALDLGLDTSTANGEMFAHVLIALAQWERRLISERTKAGLSQTDKRLGRLPLVSPSTRARVRRLFKQWGSLTRVANHLNATGVPSPSGVGRWHPATVSRLADHTPRRRGPRREKLAS
jgi:DNA invertase Pin-like site-specific DNA recombinase